MSLWGPDYLWIKRGCFDTIQVCVDCCYLQAILTDAQPLAGLHCISEENPLAWTNSNNTAVDLGLLDLIIRHTGTGQPFTLY